MDSGEARAMPAARWRALLETAAREFASAGYEQASLNRIIRVCGMSKSSFYHYVSSKHELFERTVEHFAESVADALRIPAAEEFAGGDFWANVEQLLDRLVAAAEREPATFDLGRMFYLSGAPREQHGALERVRAAAESWLDRTLAVGRASGAVRDDLPPGLQGQLALAVTRAFDEWTVRHAAEFDTKATRRLTRAQLDAFKRLLAR